ncbi:glycosyltransferase [Amaricoccus solimangrovi]|uniref:glycosyltransferase n=1 Tax=Amaricoccus solimangrovi TaxID=2589815 RepID=UPI0015E3479B|nr:glycosyltransferase [Amaricoccus solimangrovi]
MTLDARDPAGRSRPGTNAVVPLPDVAATVPVVAIPARNEAALLPRLIAALARQTVTRRLSGPLEVVIVLNNTTDGSREALRRAAELAPGLELIVEDVTYPAGRAHVGTARRRAMEIAASLRPSGALITTDADAVPADDWIEANLRAIAGGADLVGGWISGDPEEEARLGPGFQRRARLHARYDALRDELAALLDPLPHDPWPRHQDHTGASLATRAEVHDALGGLDPLPFREDLAFVAKARAAGFRLAHPLDVRVMVSARTFGRAPGGMADCLKAWLRAEEQGSPVLVRCPEALEARLRLRRAVRDGSWTGAETCLDLSPAALVELLAPDDPDAPATVPAECAIARLEARIAELRGRSDAA